MRFGAVDITLDEIFSGISKWISGNGKMNLHEKIFLKIRLPRALMGILVGAALAVGGVLMQALFRNPIVEPGLIGTSSGAAFGAALCIVLGSVFGFSVKDWGIPIAASLGALVATGLVFLLSYNKQNGKNSTVSMLLTGIAINALFMSGVGFLSYLARDPQARSITFWNMGTLSGANWSSVMVLSFVVISSILFAMTFARPLNTLLLGEEEAIHLGVNVHRLKMIVLFMNVIMVATATAFVGVIGFVGLIVPHILRMIHGSDNRYLIQNGVLLGALLVTVADFMARMLLRPAELPIGIVMSVIGVPVFIFLLKRKNYFF